IAAPTRSAGSPPPPGPGGSAGLARFPARAVRGRRAGVRRGVRSSSEVLLELARVVGGERYDDRGVVGVAVPPPGASDGGIELAGLTGDVGTDLEGFLVAFAHRDQVGSGLFL